MIIQIYEINNSVEAKAIADMGADHLGVLVGKGRFPRELGFRQAKDIFSSLPSGARAVALSLSPDLADIMEVVEKTGPHILHIGTVLENILPADVLSLKSRFPGLAIMRAIPVIDEQSIKAAKSYDGLVDWLLLDTYNKGETQIGAVGETHDWLISREIVASVEIPVILAGGLGADNVAGAIRAVRPAGVDSKTKTDKEAGTGKDLDKVKQFVEAARSVV